MKINYDLFWMVPLAAFCSPLGIAFMLAVHPPLWWVPALCMCIALAASCKGDSEQG